ncbi:translation initiation factor IF-2-like [Ixodes scapularis]
MTNVTCLFLPTFVRNDQLVQALAPYGKVIDVSYATYHRTATVKTGTRFIRMEMKEANPLPNFLRVAGHRATFDYRGLKRVCRRCRQEGHVRAQCTTGYCDRCGVFGHPTEGCTANCGRCGGTHATVDCTAKRSYSSMVTGNHATDFPALDPGNATRPIAPEAPAVPTVSTVAPPSPPDAAAAAAPPPLPSPPPPASPEPSPTGSGGTSAEATDSARTAAVIVGDTAYAAWSQALGDGEVSSDSDHLVIDENPAPGGPAETPTDSMDTTTTETPESDSNRLTHEDSKRPLGSSGSRSTDTHFRSLAQSDTSVDRYSVSSHPLLSSLPKISAEDDAGLRRPPSATELSTADLFDKLSVHVSREEILEAPASRLAERLVVADQPPPPPGTVQPYPWLALTSSTLPDHGISEGAQLAALYLTTVSPGTQKEKGATVIEGPAVSWADRPSERTLPWTLDEAAPAIPRRGPKDATLPEQEKKHGLP